MGTPRTPTNHSQASAASSYMRSPLPRNELGRNARTGQWPQASTPNSTTSFSPHPSSPGGSRMGDVDIDVDNMGQDGTFIWGTTVDVATCMNMFRDFMCNYTLDDQGFEPFYFRKLNIMQRTQSFVLDLNCSHLNDYQMTKRLYKQVHRIGIVATVFLLRCIIFSCLHVPSPLRFRLSSYSARKVPSRRDSDPRPGCTGRVPQTSR